MKNFNQRLALNFLPFLIAIIGLFFVGVISTLLQSQPKTQTISSKSLNTTTTINEASQSAVAIASSENKLAMKPANSASLHATPTLITKKETISQNSKVEEVEQNAMPIPNPSQTIKTNQITVSINGILSFTISVAEESNQCDVLNQALSNGTISSLNMRYDSNLETYAVYQINDIGKENSVWWTYKVNGQSPSQGCSFIKTKDNDNVEWRYIGS